MTPSVVTFRNGRVFDGDILHNDSAVRFVDGILCDIGAASELPPGGDEVNLSGDILSRGYTDLQVNGGGGVMFNSDPSVATLRMMAKAHRRLGVTHLLPTLITDTPEITRAAISAAIAAIEAQIPGIAGLHLEGPHLSIARKGAHDADLIRPMGQNDVQDLLSAAEVLPILKVTVAPENVTEDQVATLSSAGILISLGHTDADFETCRRYFDAGARCATHLFNAMSQIGHRAPGLVGAALADGRVSAGLIADSVHVHPVPMRIAWQAKTAPGQIFLVSDAMAVAGTMQQHFELNGRKILRDDGQLRLSDGTLAGADLDLTTAISVLVHRAQVDLRDALAAATTVPSRLCGLSSVGLQVGKSKLDDMIRIRSDLSGLVTLAPHDTNA